MWRPASGSTAGGCDPSRCATPMGRSAPSSGGRPPRATKWTSASVAVDGLVRTDRRRPQDGAERPYPVREPECLHLLPEAGRPALSDQRPTQLRVRQVVGWIVREPSTLKVRE